MVESKISTLGSRDHATHVQVQTRAAAQQEPAQAAQSAREAAQVQSAVASAQSGGGTCNDLQHSRNRHQARVELEQSRPQDSGPGLHCWKVLKGGPKAGPHIIDQKSLRGCVQVTPLG